MDCEPKYYAIKEVSEMTGVNSVTLRAWQRRYGLLNPMRTEKGHRLYSEADIAKIKHILSWLDKGVAIGKVRPLLEGALSWDVSDSEGPENRKAIESIVSALADCNGPKLDKLLIQMMKEYPLEVFIKQVVNHIENELKRPQNPLANIQSSLWQSVMTQRCIALITQAKKRSSKLCYLLSFDQPDNYRLWLNAWLLTEQGYNVTLLPSLDGKLSALRASLVSLKVNKVVVFGERRISTANLSQLTALLLNMLCECELLGSIATIHHDLIANQ